MTKEKHEDDDDQMTKRKWNDEENSTKTSIFFLNMLLRIDKWHEIDFDI